MSEQDSLHAQRLALAMKQFPEMDPEKVVAAVNREREARLAQREIASGPAREVCHEDRPTKPSTQNPKGAHLRLAFENTETRAAAPVKEGGPAITKGSHLRLV